METLLWLLWVALGWGTWRFYTAWGRKDLSRKRSKATPADEWAEWKSLAAQTRKRKQQEMEDWQAQFQDLLRATCTHTYDDQGYKQGWWICVECGYEKPWKWSPSCSCVVRREMDGTKVPYHRSGNCPVHGMPKLIAYKTAKEQETARVYSKGGYTG